MSLDAVVVLTAYFIVVWHAIKLIVRLVMGPSPIRGSVCRCSAQPWRDRDVADAAKLGIDLSRVADEPRDGGAR